MRRRFWSFWDRSGRALLLLALVAVFALGFLGITQYADSHGLQIPVGTRLYITASLFLLENGSLDGAIPWPLEIARWAAPLVLATAAVGTLVAVVRHRAWSLGTRRMVGHVVVIGLGERGWRVARTAKLAGRQVVVVEADAANAKIAAARRLGIPVVVGSATDVSRLRAARLSHAARAIVLVGETSATTAIAGAVAELSAAASFRPEFCCFLAVPDDDVARDLNALMHDQGTAFQREFFSLEGRAGAVIVDRWAGLLTAGDVPAPVVVIGSGVVARSVVAALARQWTDHPRTGASLEVSWLAREHNAVVTRGINDLDGAPIALSTHLLASSDTRGEIAEQLQSGRTPPALVVVAERDDAEALSILATADQVTRGMPTVLVGVTEGPSLVALLEGHERIVVFDIAEELGSDEQIARGRLEALGRALHEGYLRELNRSLDPTARAAKPAYRPWAELPAELRTQNYDAARAARGMLREHGLDVVPRTPLLPAVSTLDADTVEALARAEHLRWFRSRHPGVPDPEWAAVDPVHAEQSRDQARRLPEVLAAGDLQITVTGERT